MMRDSIDDVIKNAGRIYLFGAGEYGDKALDFLQMRDSISKIIGFLDNDTKKTGTIKRGYLVSSIDQIINQLTNDTLIYISMRDPAPALKQLSELGICDSQIMTYQNCIRYDIERKTEANIRFKDIHSGKRCFIMGNGPSLKDVDLELLSDEMVFSVNNFTEVANYKRAKTNFHLWMDLSFFEMREDQKYDKSILEKIFNDISEAHPVCFVPYIAAPYIVKKGLDTILNIHYLYSTDSVSEKDEIRWNISEAITSFHNVVQFAIVVAMYMGFKEIYLLGCDATNIVSLLNIAQGISNDNMHAYENDDVNERYRVILDKWGMTEILYDQYKLFLGYKKLYQECLRNNVLLVNCSSKTIINEVPRNKLENILL